MTSEDELPPEPSRAGQVLSGKYELVRKLGEGGMGVVYEAKHVLVGRHFAVKLLQRELARNREAIARFQREAQAAGALDTEHVAGITDFGFADDGAPYMVMELLRGEDTRSLLEREGPLPVPRAVHLVRQACHALAVAHARGIIHRDLKPDNLFVTRRSDGSDLVKVLDFGIAKLRHESQTPVTTQAGQMLGTLAYMPPEQVRGDKDIDHRADIHALGAILYECLTGKLPHPGNLTHVIIYHILNEPPVPVAELRPGLPPELALVVHQALARDPKDRQQSVEELAQALAPFGPVQPLSDRISAELGDTQLSMPPPKRAPGSQGAAAAVSDSIGAQTQQAIIASGLGRSRLRAAPVWLVVAGLGIVVGGIWLFGSRGDQIPTSASGAPSSAVQAETSGQTQPAAPAEISLSPAAPTGSVDAGSVTSSRASAAAPRVATARPPPASASRVATPEPPPSGKASVARGRQRGVTFDRQNPYQ